MSYALDCAHISPRRTNRHSFLRGSRRLMLTGIDSVAGWLSRWLLGRRRRKSGPRPGDPLHPNRVRLDLDRFEERAYPGSIQGWSWAGIVGANVALVDERLVDPARDVDRYWDLVKSQAEVARPANPFAIETDPTPKSTEPTEAKPTTYREYEGVERRSVARPELEKTEENDLTDDVFADPLASEWFSPVSRRGPVRVQGTESSGSAANMESAGGGSFASPNRSGEDDAGLSSPRTLDRLPPILATGGGRSKPSSPSVSTKEPRVTLSRPTTFESRDEPTRTPCAPSTTCLYVFDARKGIVTPNGVTQHAFSTWSMELHAELVGAKATTTGGYSWSFSDSAKVTNTTVTGNKLTFNWTSFTQGTGVPHDTTLTAPQSENSCLSFSLASSQH